MLSKIDQESNSNESQKPGQLRHPQAVNPIKVIHLIENYLPVFQNWIYPQIVSVPKVDSHVFCWSANYREGFPIEDSKLVVAVPPWSAAFGFPRIISLLARRLALLDDLTILRARLCRPQILHAHFGTEGWKALNLRRKLNIPLITSVYGCDAWSLPEDSPVWRQRYKELFQEGDLFLVEGPAMGKRLMDLSCPPEKVRVVHIGIDLAGLSFQAREFGEKLKIIMVGRFVEKKGLPDGLRACAVARKSGVNLQITIVGDAGIDDPKGQKIKKELLSIAQQPELLDCVRFAGYLSLAETRAVLGAHNILMCPSIHGSDGDAEGGSPVVLTEAMAMGLLCVGTRHCDIPEVIKDNETGYLCNSGDIATLASLLARSAVEPEGSLALTHRGREHIENNFSTSKQVSELADIYARLANN